MKDKSPEFIYIDDTDDSKIDVNYKFNDSIYSVVKRYKDKQPKKTDEDKIDIEKDDKKASSEADEEEVIEDAKKVENFENIPSYDLFYH